MIHSDKIDIFSIPDDRTMLLESYVRFREIYIRMLSLKSWGEACPSAVKVSIEEMRDLLTFTFSYLGNSAVNEYNIQMRNEYFKHNREKEEQEKQVALQYKQDHPEEKGGVL